MTRLLEAIYSYILDQGMDDYMEKKLYDQECKSRDDREMAFKASLSEQQKKDLEDFKDKIYDVVNLEFEAIFCAALSAGIELGSLPHPTCYPLL